MQDFINGFFKAWKAWSDDGKDAFLESFLDEVKNSKNDPTNFLGILEQEIKSLSQEGLKDDIYSMLEVIESMKNEISQGQNNPNEFVESLAQAIIETQENANKNEIELTEQKSVLEMSEDEYYEYQQEQHIQMNEDDGIARATDELEQQELESKTLQEHEENQIKRAEEISITENENELAKQELEKYALEAENKSLKQYNESQNPDTLYEQQVAQEQNKEEELSNKQDLELETLRDNNTKQGLDNESATLLESLQVIRNETNEVANYLRANEIDYSRPTGENTTSKIASLALEENNQLNEKEQARAKAHYQAMLEKERAKQQAQQNAINTPNKEVAIMDYGYIQSAPAKSRKR